jgi:hypothetical protein
MTICISFWLLDVLADLFVMVPFERCLLESWATILRWPETAYCKKNVLCNYDYDDDDDDDDDEEEEEEEV